ncbi:hypothetical protein ACVWWR_000133 [Bradyrhizobium sp. LM3.2]
MTAVTEDHQFTPDVRMAANDNPFAFAKRIPDPRAVGQESISFQAASRPSDQTLDDIV